MKSHLGSIDADDRVGLFESGFVSRAELLQQVNLHWCALLVLVKIRGGVLNTPTLSLFLTLKTDFFGKSDKLFSKCVERERGCFTGLGYFPNNLALP